MPKHHLTRPSHMTTSHLGRAPDHQHSPSPSSSVRLARRYPDRASQFSAVWQVVKWKGGIKRGSLSSDGRFADPAFARSNDDDVFDPSDSGLFGRCTSSWDDRGWIGDTPRDGEGVLMRPARARGMEFARVDEQSRARHRKRQGGLRHILLIHRSPALLSNRSDTGFGRRELLQ